MDSGGDHGLLPAFGLRYRTRERMVVQGVVIIVRSLRRVLPARLTTVPRARRHEGRHAR